MYIIINRKSEEQYYRMARMCFIRRSRGVVFLSSFVTCHRSLKLTRRTMLVERGMFVLSERQGYTPDYIGGRVAASLVSMLVGFLLLPFYCLPFFHLQHLKNFLVSFSHFNHMTNSLCSFLYSASLFATRFESFVSIIPKNGNVSDTGVKYPYLFK